ncbi:transposase DNA-binding-containing protein [Methylobacterium sp. NEAU K]|uniref:transposase DNA-binding-containing protein n=1 Tax=Methylobacterium sp. NEAU K TaxID=3064946 RepID=UPI0027332908|nr:transposase DNA-binding-containing protein [Methylobacterium sp. NEAU K]MDP4006205.1 transposase DNA-binding-containing protein [Methylobacterium sp. NEAU K]
MSGGVVAGDAGWQDAELACTSLPDQRLGRRLRRLLDQPSSAPGQPVPAACPGKIGFTRTINGGRDKAGQPNVLTLCGVLMHSSLAVSLAGTPLGLTAVKFWTRTKFKGTWTLKRHVNPTRVPIETKENYRWLENLRQSMAFLGTPERCVHVAVRESNMYELFFLAQDLRTRFLVRVQTNRLAEPPPDAPQPNADHRVFAQLDAAPWSGRHQVDVGGNTDETACLHVKFATITTRPPIGKQKRYSPQVLTYIHALELDPPAGRQAIDWKLVTNLPVADLTAAVEKLGWYALRWKAEVFHKVMKSGCRAEESRLQTSREAGEVPRPRHGGQLAHLLRNHVGPRQT